MDEIIRGAHRLVELVEQSALEGAKTTLEELSVRVDQRLEERGGKVVPLHG